jgi:hypothetical protein
MKAQVSCFLALSGIFIAAGCEKSPYVPVSGRVTMDGKPLAKVQVQFQPSGGTLKKPAVGRGSIATTDEDGKFNLRVDPKQSGAVAGPHRVAISKQIAQIETIPNKFNSNSTLTFDVPPEGTAAADFELHSR